MASEYTEWRDSKSNSVLRPKEKSAGELNYFALVVSNELQWEFPSNLLGKLDPATFDRFVPHKTEATDVDGALYHD